MSNYPFRQPVSSALAWKADDNQNNSGANANTNSTTFAGSGVGGQAYGRLGTPSGGASSFPRPPIITGGPSPFMQPVSAALGWLHAEAKDEEPQQQPTNNNNNNSNKSGGGGGGGGGGGVHNNNHAQHHSSDNNHGNHTHHHDHSSAGGGGGGGGGRPPPGLMQPVSAALGWANNNNNSNDNDNNNNNSVPQQQHQQQPAAKQEEKREPSRHQPPPDAEGFAAEYTIGRQLGEGAFAVVKECFNADDERFAVKVMRKSAEEAKNAMIRREIALMKELRHSPKIVRLYDVFEDENTFHLVLEFEEGGDLFDRLVERERLSEKIARDVFRDVVMALTVCHEQCIVHRDLKPENLLLSRVDKGTIHEFSEVKLADFGMAMRTGEDDASLSGFCGTPFYMAPEVIKGEKYGRPVDCWSLGTILYTILTGWPPFYHNNDKVLYTLIKENRPDFDNKQWSMVSAEAKDLCQRLLQTDPAKRYTIEDVASHPWVALIDAPEVNLHHALHHLRSFNARRKFRAAAWAVMVPSRLQTALKALKRAAGDGPGGVKGMMSGPPAIRRLQQANVEHGSQLTIAELHKLLTDLGFKETSSIDQVAAMLDSEGTGMADKSELLCMLGMIMGDGGEDAMHFCFRALDADNSGELSRDELVKLLNFVEFGNSDDVAQELTALFECMDANGDGQISFSEFRNAIGADPNLAAAWKGGTTMKSLQATSPTSQSKFANRRSALKGMERTFSGTGLAGKQK